MYTVIARSAATKQSGRGQCSVLLITPSMLRHFLPRNDGLLGALAFVLVASFALAVPVQIGEQGDGSTIVSTRQAVAPAGESVTFRGRPVDLVLSPDGATCFVKDNRGLVVIDAATWAITQELPFIDDEGGSMHGIAVSPDGATVYLTSAKNRMFEARRGAAGTWEWAGSVTFPGPKPGQPSFPCGIAIARDGKTVLVCLSRNNALELVDLAAHAVTKTFATDVAPYEVLFSDDQQAAYVSNWGGRTPAAGEASLTSSGTPVVVDERGVAASGTVGKYALADGRALWTAETGLHPSALALSGGILYVANVNSDTVSALNADSGKVLGTYSVHADAGMAFGNLPNALAVDAAGQRLYVACGGTNAVAVLDINAADHAPVLGLIPTGWFPGAIALRGQRLFVANVKGLGSRTPDPRKRGLHVKFFTGTVNRVALPDAAALAKYTKAALAYAQTAASAEAREAGRAQARPLPVPRRPGAPSSIKHVVYIIKENRTYDQILGDLPQGNGEPRLCTFPREYTPNTHALAEQFVLLDNYYCNGVVSADGHSWATEGITTDHLEKSFGGFSRSYTFGDDPLTFASSGFIWDGILRAGKRFYNYGEFDTTETVPRGLKFVDVWKRYSADKTVPALEHIIGLPRVKAASHPDYPGWNLGIPDQYRADVFIRDLQAAEAKGEWPDFITLYLPNDHTSGTDEDMPTPRAQVADNDLALGRIVEAISRSKFWPETAIFVNEDDAQDGYDHVDGHRSICLVISPFAKRGKVVSEFYSQTSVLHTIGLIFGVPPMNQMDAMAHPMGKCFDKKANLAPFTALPAGTRLDEVNPKKKALNGDALHWAMESAKLDLSKPDRADEDTLNRIVWHAMKGVDAAYPAEWAGAHGRGLKRLGLSFGGAGDDDEDEEEHERGEHGAGS